MKKPQFTKEPWERNGNTVFALTLYTGVSAKMRAMVPRWINRFSLMVSNDNGEATAEEIEANAKLIQSAPQMAEALEALLSAVPADKQNHDAYAMAKDALAAAGYEF
jgi:hypothetical protein